MANAAVDSGVNMSTKIGNGVVRKAGNLIGEAKNATDDTIAAVQDGQVLLNKESGFVDKIKAGLDLGKRAINGVTRTTKLANQGINTLMLPLQLPNVLGSIANGATQAFNRR